MVFALKANIFLVISGVRIPLYPKNNNMIQYLYNFNVLYLEIFLTLFVVVLVIFNIAFEKISSTKRLILIEPNVYLILLLFGLSIILVNNNSIDLILTVNNTFYNDLLTSNVKIITLIFLILVIFISVDYITKKNIISYEYFLIMLLSIIGLFLLISSNNLLSIYISLELMSLSFYLLAAIKRNSEYSTEAAFKYFMLGALASAIMLFSFSYLYGITGITNIEDLSKLLLNIQNQSQIEYSILYVNLFLFISALLFKLGVAPFHMWLPDVYEGSVTSITSFFAIIPKIIILSVIIKIFLFNFYDFTTEIQHFLVIFSLISVLIGSITGLAQKKVKRLFAYSTIGHTGYIILALSTNSLEGIHSIYLYIIIYMIMSVVLFSIILNTRTIRNHIQIKYLNEFVGFSKSNPIIAMTLTIVLFSMAGIPPLAGFFSKFYVFSSAILANYYLASIVIILISVISAVYYIYLIKIIYFDNTDYWTLTDEYSKSTTIIMSTLTIFIVLFFIYPSYLLNFSYYLTIQLFI